MVRLTIFLVITLGIAWISRRSLLVPASHGFYRFWAWVTIVGLILLVLPDWFRDPLALRQIVAWALLAASLAVLIPGLAALRARGRAERGEQEGPADGATQRETLYAFEKTTSLVTTGVFRYIRHPMYASLFYLAWGAFFKRPSWVSGALVGAATLFLHLTATTEEVENLVFFGDAYRDYMKRTKRFLPLLY